MKTGQQYPIDEVLDELKRALTGHNSVVLHAPPGAGKTTRVPLALLDVFQPDRGKIIMLEPRRLAAVNAARWMARQLGEQVGETVGYAIRFDRKVSRQTRIEVVTEGILTRRIQHDPALEDIALVIFDEFHERSIHADLALALCLDSRRHLRADLKILVMSATLNVGPISKLLGNAPVISSEGRSYLVEERYVDSVSDRSLTARVTEAIATAIRETEGDILVFLPGAGEIRSCAESLDALPAAKDVMVHPLYGDLPFEEQERAIMPGPRRKIVLATNIAETSLTIEGVRVVIDCGLTRRLQYDPAGGMNRLVTVSVSQAAAEQRKGRAGRLGPGACYRLYGRHAFQAMLPFAPPELLISDLSSLVLDLAAWGVRKPSSLAWLDDPPESSVNTARDLLTSLGALDESGAATPLGREMARFPVHPRAARLMLRAAEVGAAQAGADLAALLSERDIFRRRSGETEAVDPDITERMAILRSWREGKERPHASVDTWALRTVDKTAKQLARLISPVKEGTAANEHDVVALLLLDAFPDRIARKREDGRGRFVLSQGRGVRLPEQSHLADAPFIVAAHLDAGSRGEGVVRLAAPLTEDMIRQECGPRIRKLRRLEWNERQGRISATLEERIDSLILSARDFVPDDSEAGPVLCAAIRDNPGLITFGDEARQFQGRVALMRRCFADEEWPDMSEGTLLSDPCSWLSPFLSGMRTAQDLKRLDLAPALRAQVSPRQSRLLEERTPRSLTVPSGSRIPIDYGQGEEPVLAVKLQEMFGLADTPTVAGGRVKVLLHLLSPARRPVQITRDLKGFWNGGYHEVRKELRGRYPKHPWPDDPWNAVPTRKAKPRGR